MLKRLFSHIALLIALLATAVACSSNDEPTEERRYDFVTYLGYAQGMARWQYIGPGDSEPLDMLALMPEPEKIKPGQRVLLSYSVPDAAHRITVYGITYANVASDSLRVNVKPVDQYPKHPIKLGALWRTGDYINLRCEVEYTTKTRALYMMADRATLDADTIDVHLIHDLMAADSTYFWRACYGSFYVGRAFDRTHCKAIRVHLNDVTYPKKSTYVFGKTK
ncbi:MAG: NigD-like C-terminal domain-containing protein [Bacteroidales bacterium]|nr:NigD-like C-terminal domain-containing protein [Bacteroidales bacterium]